MASNTFGNVFKIMTWGESHGKAIGVVIDGCPAGLALTEEDINQELAWRSPGQQALTSPRREIDQAEILSGVFEGQTTGAPISILIWNRDAQSQAYEPLKSVLRPGHANYTYLQKYGCFDYRGGGRASARETACRVAAGAIAKKLLSLAKVEIVAYLKSVGHLTSNYELSDVESPQDLRHQVKDSAVFCPLPENSQQIVEAIEAVKQEGDSIGGLIEAIAWGLPVGWGDPVYEKLEANLAKAMLSIPASKGFEIGMGFGCADMKGSDHNDLFYQEHSQVRTQTNHAGGTLGGISTGMPIVIRIPFKPASSIQKPQQTLDLNGHVQTLQLPAGSRHDPCVAIRAVPVVEAMFALVLADAMLMNQGIQIQNLKK